MSPGRRPVENSETGSPGPATLPGMDLALLRSLARGGLLSTRAAEAAGVDRRELALAARRGQVTRLWKGWYTTVSAPSVWELHRLRTVAALIDFPGRAASHHTGLILRGIPTYRAPLATVQLVAVNAPRRLPRGLRVRPRTSICTETVALGPHEIACLPVATCIVESGSAGLAESALVSADASLASGLVSHEQLEVALAGASGRRGIRELRRVLSWTDSRRESPGESRMAVSLHRLGYAFTPQMWIGNDRVDAILDDAPVVLEFDGKLKYTEPEDLFDEKRREDRIRARGYDFVRRGWDDVGDLRSLDHEIRAKVDRWRPAA